MRKLISFISLLIFSFSFILAQEEETNLYGILEKVSSLINNYQYKEAEQLLHGKEDMAHTEILRTLVHAAKTRTNMGLGDYVKAMDNYRLSRVYSPDDETDDMLRLIGSELYFAIGEYQRVLEIVDSINTHKYEVLKQNHKVRALTMLERYPEAISTASLAMEKTDSQDGSAQSILLQNRGYAEWHARNLEEAKKDLYESINLCGNDKDSYNIEGNLAMVESELGNHSVALRLINEAVEGLPVNSPDQLTARRKRAVILRNAGRHRESSKEFRNYFNYKKGELSKNFDGMLPSERLNYWVREKELLSRCFDERSDAALMYDVASYRKLISMLGMKDDNRLRKLLKVSTSDIRKSLKEGDVAMEIVSYDDADKKRNYAALILPKRGDISFVKLIDEEEFYKPGRINTNSIYDAIREESSSAKNLLYSDTLLAEQIWRPILKALPPETNEIYFSPEGIFHFLGLENLPFRERDNYKIHRISGTVFLTDRENEKEEPSNFLIIGGLDYDRKGEKTGEGSHNKDAFETLQRGGSFRFNYLKGTAAEADSIGGLYNAGKVLHKAEESFIKSIFPYYDVVHIATHGYSLDFGIKKRPEFLADSIAIDRSLLGSGVALSGANCGYDDIIGEDGLLSAREICEMDLSGVDLVVLSACRTALGDIMDEGATGLVRALKMAGAKTIIASLWEVDDMSTMLFMKNFHKEFSENGDIHQAFNNAKAKLREEPVLISYHPFSPRTLARERKPKIKSLPPFSEPYYWAPFILIDN